MDSIVFYLSDQQILTAHLLCSKPRVGGENVGANEPRHIPLHVWRREAKNKLVSEKYHIPEGKKCHRENQSRRTGSRVSGWEVRGSLQGLRRSH